MTIGSRILLVIAASGILLLLTSGVDTRGRTRTTGTCTFQYLTRHPSQMTRVCGISLLELSRRQLQADQSRELMKILPAPEKPAGTPSIKGNTPGWILVTSLIAMLWGLGIASKALLSSIARRWGSGSGSRPPMDA